MAASGAGSWTGLAGAAAVRAGLARHERLRGGERHSRLDRVELQRSRLLRAASLPVELAVRRVAQHAERRIAQIAGRRDRVHRARLERVRRRPLLPARDPLDRGVGPAQARQPDRPAPAREEPELRLRQAHLRRLRHRAVARGETQLEAASDADTIDRGHARSVQILERREDRIGLEDPAGQVGFALLEVRQELRDVGTHAEGVLAARQQDPAEALPRAQLVDSGLERGQRHRVELVDRLAGQVEPQLDQSVIQRQNLEGLPRVTHGLLLEEGRGVRPPSF